MPKRSRVDRLALDALLAPGRAVATHAQLKAVGMPMSTITRRIGPEGPWQRALPGVVVGHRGTLTSYERRLATQAYAGSTAMLTGLDALAELGVKTARATRDERVHVLVEHGCHRTAHGFAIITRTRGLPVPAHRRGLRCAPLARALVDACRRLRRLDDVRELVADVVQNHHVSPDEIGVEIRRAARQRTALARAVLVEISAGVRSAAEAKLREEFRRAAVPEPLWNAVLMTPDGEVIASPDALWHAVWLALELDSMAWHLGPRAYLRTQRRQRRLVVLGIEVLPVSPSEILKDPSSVCREVMDKLRTAVPRELEGVMVQARSAA